MGKHNKIKPRKLNIKDQVFGNKEGGKSINFLAKDVIGNTISKDENLIGFFDITKRPIFRKAIKFDFTNQDIFDIVHNLNILNYVGAYYFSKDKGIINLELFIKDIVGVDNIDILSYNVNNIHIESDEMGIYENIGGYIILEYTKNNVESGLFCEDDIQGNNIDLSKLGELCLTYNSANPNSCDPQPPIELIDILLEFEKNICALSENQTTKIQSDYAETDVNNIAYIKNKPDIPTHEGEVIGEEILTLHKTAITNKIEKLNPTTNDYLLISSTDDGEELRKVKFTNLPANVPANVQSDYAETDTSTLAYINNKPELATQVDVDLGVNVDKLVTPKTLRDDKYLLEVISQGAINPDGTLMLIKGNTVNIEKISTGRYRMTHSIGNLNYIIIITPTSSLISRLYSETLGKYDNRIDIMIGAWNSNIGWIAADSIVNFIIIKI